MGEGAEFTIILENTPEKIKRVLNQTINDYLTPQSMFGLSIARETNQNVFKFFRSYRPIILKPEVFEFALQNEELAKIYGVMLGFAIAKLTDYNLTKDELNYYFRVCEKAILLRAKKAHIELVGNAIIALKNLNVADSLSAEELVKLKNSLLEANSVDSFLLVYREIEKVNRIINPRYAAGTKTWHYSPQLA